MIASYADLSVAALLAEAGIPVRPKPEPIRLQVSEYAVRWMRGDRVLRSAVYTGLGDKPWHVPLPPKPAGRWRTDSLGLRHRVEEPRVAWCSVATRDEAIAALGAMR